VVRKIRIVIAALVALLAGLVAAPIALAGTCPGPCLAVGVSDILNGAPQASSVDSISGSKVLHGTRGWFVQMNNASTLTTTNASISVQSGYPASKFMGVSSLPVSTSAATLSPNQQLGLNLNSTIGVAFAAGFNSSRAMSPGVVPAGGGHQVVKVTFTRTSSTACITNTPGLEGCAYIGDLETGLAGASVETVAAPSNLNQSEGFTSKLTASGANWTLNDPILGKKYVVTVLISLPARAKSYHYKPMLGLDLGASGPHGCGSPGGDPCATPTTHVTLSDAALDGATLGAGQITFSVDQSFEWDEGGPPREADVRCSGLVH
jgi:hypothetical protein